ncbi:MAG: hypothetical protein HS116_17000 [Planctomycetes bacterium]|nr:hypothetical protein [Planctomycetota bacterium]
MLKDTLLIKNNGPSGGPFPSFIVDPSNADPHWVDCIVKILQQIDFEDRRYFDESTSTFFRLGAINSFEWVIANLDFSHGDDPKLSLFKIHLRTVLGNAIFAMIGSSRWSKLFPKGKQSGNPLPIHDIDFLLRERSINVVLSSLKRGKYGGYCSRRDLNIQIDGKPKYIAFSEHAIERTYQRIIGSMGIYASWGDAFAFFDRCRYFEPVLLRDGENSLSFFQDCFLEQHDPSILMYPNEYALRISGFESLCYHIEFGIRSYYRVGYAPIVSKGDWILLKTLLPPGYAGTPELDLFQNVKMAPNKRRRLLKMTDHWTVDQLNKSFDFSLFKFFHQNGIPQVVQFTGDLFAPLVGSISTLEQPKRVEICSVPAAPVQP